MKGSEEARLCALADYRVLDTGTEPAFDNIARLTAKIFGTPISLVSLVDEHRQWFKAHHGLDIAETPREQSFCAHAIQADATLMVPDALLDPRFSANPLVKGDPFIRFYCGVPLRTRDGHGLGTLCIIDREPRELTPQQLSLLEALARQVELELEIRRRLSLLEEKLGRERERTQSKELLAAMIVHDMRGPLTTITMLASLVEPANEISARDLKALVGESKRLRHMLADILDVCLHEVGGLRLRPTAFAVAPVARDVARRAERLGLEKGCSVRVVLPEVPVIVEADSELFVRVLENLVGNAIGHAEREAPITLTVWRGAERALFEVMDHNPVIPESERRSIFEPLQQGKAPSSHRGHGLGLAFCRLAVEAHGGRLEVRPNAEGDGNTFCFDLPAARSA